MVGWRAAILPERERERVGGGEERGGMSWEDRDRTASSVLCSSPLAGGTRAGRESLRRALSLRLPEILAGIGPRLLPHARAAFASAPPSFSRFASSCHLVTSRAGGAHGTHAARIHFTLARPVVDEQAGIAVYALALWRRRRGGRFGFLVLLVAHTCRLK